MPNKNKVNAGGLTFKDLNNKKIIFIPVGSFECHGEMLPLGTDSFITLGFCQQFAIKVNGLVLPLVNYAPCSTTIKLYGTVHIANEHFKKYLSDICTTLWKHGFKKIVIVSTHSGCDAVLKVLVEELFADKGIIVFYFNPFKSGAKEIDVEVFGDRNNSYKECSLLLAALRILAEEEILNETLNRKSDEKQNRRPEIEEIRHYGTIGFHYDKPNDHVAGVADADINLGLKYYEKQIERFMHIMPVLERSWESEMK